MDCVQLLDLLRGWPEGSLVEKLWTFQSGSTHCEVVVSKLPEVLDEHLLYQARINSQQIGREHLEEAAERSFVFEFTRKDKSFIDNTWLRCAIASTDKHPPRHRQCFSFSVWSSRCCRRETWASVLEFPAVRTAGIDDASRCRKPERLWLELTRAVEAFYHMQRATTVFEEYYYATEVWFEILLKILSYQSYTESELWWHRKAIALSQVHGTVNRKFQNTNIVRLSLLWFSGIFLSTLTWIGRIPIEDSMLSHNHSYIPSSSKDFP